MIFPIKSSARLPATDVFPLSTYALNFSIERILPGVDNVRHDVHISPGFHGAATKVIVQLIAKHFQLPDRFPVDKPAAMAKKTHAFREMYRILMEDAIHKSKLFNERQIDSLALAAFIRMLVEETRKQFDRMTGQIKNIIRKYEQTDHQDLKEAVKTKEALSNVLQNRDAILRHVGQELFDISGEVHRGELKAMREANFGVDTLVSDDVLDNPIFHTDNPYNDTFLIEAYDVVFGRRLEDPDRYDSLMAHIKRLLALITGREGPPSNAAGDADPDGSIDVDGLIKHVDNIDLLVDYYAGRARLIKAKKAPSIGENIPALRRRLRGQRRILNLFYREFSKVGLVERMAASYEMRPIYRNYCPPLVPQQVLQFMIDRRSRKAAIRRLKQLRKLYNRSFTLRPLKKKIKRLRLLTGREKKIYLIRFLKGMVRYHRDLENFKILNEAMERINLTNDEKTIHLSRANNTLYAFLLPHERSQDEKPIKNHVVIKADVRGSTDITHQMNRKGLNPASYFSLNFFNPITDILNTYGAMKVFIEGDAIILSIMEREHSPEGWYAVARACGLAINMLQIIQRYNEKNRRNQLPVLELGIGVCYLDQGPTFLFDGDQRIMISSAINLADRQSSCAKTIRGMFQTKKPPFNLYVFESAGQKASLKTADDLLMRYNVNGIELNAHGFAKLQQEIKLTTMTCQIPRLQSQAIKIHTGKFPSTTGRYQRLVVREDVIRRIDPSTLAVSSGSVKQYYEICTHPLVYQAVRERL